MEATVESKGYVTETGRVVQKVKRPMDPGQARQGVRWSADTFFEEIVGTLWRHQSGLRGSEPVWVVRHYPGDEEAARARTRKAALDTFLASR